ncbi:MAG: hypothetical protein HQ473_07835 [Cryomorphaceae bacterium]|nr:hypothetical protein [Cryomorphaceae bacterium]
MANGKDVTAFKDAAVAHFFVPVEVDPQIGDRREREEPRRGARASVPNRFYDLP